MRNQTGRSPESKARGNGMVFALFLPVGMVEITAALDSGRGIHGYSIVANSARKEVRYGSVHPADGAGMISTARASAPGLAPSQLTVTASQPTADTLRVQVNHSFPLVTPLIPDVVGGGMLPLQSTTTNTGY